MTTAELTQPMQALQKAQRIRLASVDRRRQIEELSKQEGMRLVADLLEDPPRDVASTRLRLLLRSIRSFGPSKIERLLRPLGLVHALERRVGPCEDHHTRPLSERQRKLIASALRGASK